MNKLILRTLSLVLVSSFSFNSFSQNDCAGSVPVPTLDGSVCATSAASTTNFLAAGGCEEGTNDTWFSFTAQGGTADFTVTGPGGFRPEYLIVSSTTNDCNNYVLEDCVDGTGNYNVITGTTTGLTIGDIYYVVVSSNGNATGTVTVCVDNPAVVANCVNNEECVSAQVITLNAAGGAASCITDCNNGATPGIDFVGANCEDQPFPAVWYEFTTGAATSSIDIGLTSAAFSNPEFALYLGNACGPWTIVACSEGAAGAANMAAINVASNQTYVLAVSDATGDEGNFNLCITQNPDNSACNTTDALNVISTSMGSPLAGPYQPGEAVNFCYTITNWQMINCNYLGAVVPTFGDCWDPSSFGANGVPSNITTALNVNGVIQPCPPGPPCAYAGCAGAPSGAWSWFSAGAAVYNVNGYYPAGTAMPAGWYFLSSYNPATGACAPDPTDPDNTFGDGNFPNCGTNTFDYTVCFTLTAGPLANCTAGSTDCAVSMKTFADGEFGAWNNIGCTVDAASTTPAGFSCLLPATVLEFTGDYESGYVNLVWTTSSEQNTDYFIISRSTKFGELKEIGRLDAAGNSEIELNYRFADNAPHPGVNYYKLETVDTDGSKRNNGYVSVTADFEYAFFNGDKQEIVLTYPSNVEIYSMDGKLVKTSIGKQKIAFDLNGFFLIRDLSTGILQRISTY
jgi:hypothetical protein